MTLDHAMFFLLLLQYDRYDELADRLGKGVVPQERRVWPPDHSGDELATEEVPSPPIEIGALATDGNMTDNEGDDFFAEDDDVGGSAEGIDHHCAAEDVEGDCDDYEF